MSNDSVELQLNRLLQEVGKRGILVDQAKLATELRGLQNRLAEIESQSAKLIGRSIRMSSRKDAAVVLYDILKFPEPMKRSVAARYTMHFKHPWVSLYREWQTVSRTASLIKAMAPFIAEDSRVVTEWQSTNETSGRIYCQNFNVQQLPLLGRKALVPDRGQMMMLADFKQVELRVFAALANVKFLINAFAQKEDPHRTTASLMLGIPLAEVTDEQRERAKVFNFGLIFGMEPVGLAQRLNVSVKEAEGLYMDFFGQMPEASVFIRAVKSQARLSHEIVNDFGHLRKIEDWSDPEKAGRQAVNTLVQGTAASILKRAILRVSEVPGVTVLATVHDSILVEFPKSTIEDFPRAIVAAMETEFRGVKFPVDYAIGDSWGDCMLAMNMPELELEE